MIVKEKLLAKALEAWGSDAQKDMAIEEMAELIFALQKLKRKRGKSMHERIQDVQEEIADVLMMMQQMRMLFGADKVDVFIEMKTGRLKRRLKDAEGGG